MLVKFEHAENATLPMAVTLMGMIMLVKPELSYTDFYGHGSIRHSEVRGKDERSKVV